MDPSDTERNGEGKFQGEGEKTHHWNRVKKEREGGLPEEHKGHR